MRLWNTELIVRKKHKKDDSGMSTVRRSEETGVLEETEKLEGAGVLEGGGVLEERGVLEEAGTLEETRVSEEASGQEKTEGISVKEKKETVMEQVVAVKDRFTMEVESRSRNEAFARVVVAVFSSRLDPTMEEVEDLKTAVSEAVTNAVIHGYEGREVCQDGSPALIYIEAEIEGHQLTVSIADKGKGIPNVKQAMEPMFTTDETGERSGMGFSFMEAFMDELQVESEPGKGTKVTMKKRMGR